jgi:hypothetical protein
MEWLGLPCIVSSISTGSGQRSSLPGGWVRR